MGASRVAEGRRGIEAVDTMTTTEGGPEEREHWRHEKWGEQEIDCQIGMEAEAPEGALDSMAGLEHRGPGIGVQR